MERPRARAGRGRGAALVGAALLLGAAGAAAQVRPVEREVSALGADANEAVAAALQEATFQICGVRIRSSARTGTAYTEADGKASLVETVQREIERTSKKPGCGFDGYDVVEVGPSAGATRATVRVRYHVYRTPGPDVKRRRLVVAEFPIDEVHLYGAGGARVGGQATDFALVRNLEAHLRARIEALLTQGRRFAVLDRARDDLYEAEKVLLRSGDAATRERARLGQVLGADYVVHGTVHRLTVEAHERTLALTGERSRAVVAHADVRFSVLAVASRQVKWSSDLEVVHDAGVGAGRPELLAAAVLDDAAERIVDALTESIYPAKIAKVLGGGAFVVNRGAGAVREGDVFEVFAEGEAVVDPDTGERLDRLETSIGVARVVDVKPKHSVARLISEVVPLEAAMVLRRARVERVSASAPAAQGVAGDADGDGLPDYLNRP